MKIRSVRFAVLVVLCAAFLTYLVACGGGGGGGGSGRGDNQWNNMKWNEGTWGP